MTGLLVVCVLILTAALAWSLVLLRRLRAERQRIEVTLRASEAKFHMAFRASPDTMMIVTLDDSRVVDVNQGFERNTGYRRDEAIGRTVPELNLWCEPEKRELMLEKLRQWGEIRGLEGLFRGKSGDVGSYMISIALIELEGRPHLFTVAHNITPLKRAEKQREGLIRELEEKNGELERFTYTVSHDLKSPLVTIRGFIGLLRQDAVDGNAQGLEEDLRYIESAAEKMSRLLDELLSLSHVGRKEGTAEEVDLGDLAREARALVDGSISDHGVEVVIAPDLPRLVAERGRIVEVFQNLLENAAKYMGGQTAPRVEVGTRRDDGETVYYVRDNGVGIAPEYHETVFGLFERLDSDSDGTGIGLALAKRVVEVHGGRIWVESEGVGTGSTFCFTLPAASGEA